MKAQTVVNVIIALGVVGIIIYLGEQNSGLVLLAILGIVYLMFSTPILKTVGVA